MDGRTKAFSRFKMHECKKSKLEKKWTRCDVDDAILNEYRWLGSSPRQEEEEKKLLQSVAMQWWKSSLMAFWSRFFFSLNEATPHPQTFFAFESWTVDIIVFESWHELFIFNLCFCITTKTARLLPFMKREREKTSQGFSLVNESRDEKKTKKEDVIRFKRFFPFFHILKSRAKWNFEAFQTWHLSSKIGFTSNVLQNFTLFAALYYDSSSFAGIFFGTDAAWGYWSKAKKMCGRSEFWWWTLNRGTARSWCIQRVSSHH